MPHFSVADWDDAYSNGAHIAGGERWPAAWDGPARVLRARLAQEGRARLDLPYGPAPRNRFDLFLPPQIIPKGLVVFIHGGYWMETGKSTWSHLAAGPLAHGYAVALPSYTQCPDIRVSGIVREVAAATEAAASMVDGPLMLSGHSAGGHLACRMVCAASPLAAAMQARVRHVVSVSGLHDLRPLLRTSMNAQLRLDAAEAATESPALLESIAGVRLTCWAGSAERAEFVRQNALLANVWTGLGVATQAVLEPDRHHFSVIDGLADPAHPLTLALVAEGPTPA